jgi:ATP-dependent RNA helicase DeaD
MNDDNNIILDDQSDETEPDTGPGNTIETGTIETDDTVEAEEPVISNGFDTLGLRQELLNTLTALGYEEPTPIQAETIPLLLSGIDLVGQAATGTGKTAAFALPILQRITAGDPRPKPMALILVPTRELAVQVSEAIWRYGRDLGAKVVPLYGGQPIFRQLQALQQGVHVVVATPGRAIDHIKRGTLPLGDVRMVVLDEADEMLDMGFAEDIESILSETPADRQTVLFSATMPPRIDAIARRHLNKPTRIQIARTATPSGEAPLVRQSAYVVSRAHKPAALGRILDVEAPAAAIVFCRTRIEVDQLTETLTGRGYRAEALHGGMSQEQRDRVMGRVRNGTAELLIATDVAARGLDIDVLTHVVNYDVPSAPEAYVHRIGRVGRAGREGVAITLAEPREQRQLANIERLIKQKITVEKVPSVAELRARQMELTLTSLRVALDAEDEELAPFRTAVQSLRSEFDALDVAAAALKLVHEASGNTLDEADIPDLSQRMERERERPVRERPDRSSSSGGATARIYFGLGKLNNIRPGDLVGAIANETHLIGKEIGPIKVADRFSIVGVPESAANEVIEAMKRTTFKGKKTTVRLYTEDGQQRDTRPTPAAKPWEAKKKFGGTPYAGRKPQR